MASLCSITAAIQYAISSNSIPLSSSTENPNWTRPAKTAAEGVENPIP
jgi:hypothetical protein